MHFELSNAALFSSTRRSNICKRLFLSFVRNMGKITRDKIARARKTSPNKEEILRERFIPSELRQKFLII